MSSQTLQSPDAMSVELVVSFAPKGQPAIARGEQSEPLVEEHNEPGP